MKFTVEFDLDKSELAMLCQNSVERVFNNAINVGGDVENARKTLDLASLREDASTLWQDCEELKPVFTKIQRTIQNRIFELKLR